MTKPRTDKSKRLLIAYNWLCQQDDSISFGLRSTEDGLKLFGHFMGNPRLPEFCDTDDMAHERVKCLGYDPMGDAAPAPSMKTEFELTLNETADNIRKTNCMMALDIMFDDKHPNCKLPDEWYSFWNNEAGSVMPWGTKVKITLEVVSK
jgi:hypothetical protein